MNSFNYEDEILDLHDIALLLNYERASTEPRFRHAKLREVIVPGDADFKTIRIQDPEWTESPIPRTGYVFEKSKGRKLSKQEEEEERDLPSNILSANPTPSSLRNATPQELEMYYWQPRNHDGCFRTVALFQYFIDLFPEHIRTRVRVVEDNKPRVYSTLASDRSIVEFSLFQPKSMNASVVLHDGQTYLSGSDPTTLHAVLGFPPPGGDIETILDLSSLQFGEVGRGFKGKGLFVLEPRSQYVARLSKFASANEFESAKISERIRGAPNEDWLRKVAKRTKERWEKRASEPWCGHCGAPSRGEPLKRCATCQKAYYCDAIHQRAAWPFHKHFCIKETK